MTERREIWSAGSPVQAVRYQAVCSPLEDNPEVACTYGLACLGDCQGTWVQMDLIEDVSPSRDNVPPPGQLFQPPGALSPPLPGRGAGQPQWMIPPDLIF